MTFALLLAGMLALAVGDNSLAAARDLYASAAYEDALAVLNTLPPDRPADEARAIEQYRALCLLALGRGAEAETAITAVISGDPTYRPAADVSPRVRAAFADVRRKMIPVILQHWYTQAKAQYDRREFAAAASLFGHILQIMADPEIQRLSAQPPLSDLRTLVSGFRDLAASALPPDPLSSSPLQLSAMAMPALPATPRVYAATDGNVVPPTVVLQELPAFPGVSLIGKVGLIEVVIDESGGVESAMIRQTLTPQYDKIAIAATKKWRYEPATVDGVPVKYRKSIQVTVKPAPKPGRSNSELN
jgi:TonB family protein